MFLFVLCVSWLLTMWFCFCVSGPVVVLKRGMLCDVEFFSMARLPTSLMDSFCRCCQCFLPLLSFNFLFILTIWDSVCIETHVASSRSNSGKDVFFFDS